jgi:ketosteroid isomerase-like protein
MWPLLKAGEKVQVPFSLPHPSVSGFDCPDLAEDVGQSTDWVASFRDGSRVHLHEFTDGRIVAHRDKVDPARGPLDAVWHWFTEARSGQIAAAGLLAYVAYRGLS